MLHNVDEVILVFSFGNKIPRYELKLLRLSSLVTAVTHRTHQKEFLEDLTK